MEYAKDSKGGLYAWDIDPVWKRSGRFFKFNKETKEWEFSTSIRSLGDWDTLVENNGDVYERTVSKATNGKLPYDLANQCLREIGHEDYINPGVKRDLIQI